MANRARGIAIAVLGTLAITPDALLLRLARPEAPSFQALFAWRGAFTALSSFLLTMLLNGGLGPTLSRARASLSWPLACGVLLQAGLTSSFCLAVLLVDTARVMVLLALNPLIAALLAWLLLKEAVPLRTVAALALAFLSVLIIIAPQLSQSSSDAVPGEVAALATACLFAAWITCNRYVSKQRPECLMQLAPSIGMFLTTSAIALCAGASAGGLASLAVSPKGVALLAADALCLAGSYVALTLAPRYVTGPEVSMIFLGEVVLAPVWVYMVLGEVPAETTFAGGGLLLCTLLLHEAASFVMVKEKKGEPLLPVDGAAAAGA